MRKLILVLLFLAFSTLSFARGGGGAARVGGGFRGGYVGQRGVSVGIGSRVFIGAGNWGVFIGGYPSRGGYAYRGRYGYGRGAYYGGWGLGFGLWPGYDGYGYDGYGYDVNNAAVPNNGNVPNYPNVPNNGDVAPHDPNTANVSHSGAVVITVGPDGYTRDGVFHSFH